MRMFRVAGLVIFCGVATARGVDVTGPSSASTPPDALKRYDCAANSLYVIARVSGIEISYARCLELLPDSPGGNSMLQVKKALTTLGLQVEAVEMTHREVVGLRVPAIILFSPPGEAAGPRAVGHFSVVRPVDEQRVQMLDYMQGPPEIIHSRSLVEYLESRDMRRLRLLLCGRRGQVLSDMLVGPAKDDLPAEVGRPAASSDRPALVELRAATKHLEAVGWNFGEAVEGSTLSRKFEIQNLTGKKVHIDTIRTSCGCTALTADRTEIPAGEKAVLSMDIGLAGLTPPALSVSGLVVFAEGDGLPPLRLQAVGTIVQRWVCEPGVIDLGVFKSDSEPVVRHALVRPALKQIKGRPKSPLLSARTDSTALTASLQPAEGGPPGSYQLTVRFDPQMTSGLLRGVVHLTVEGQKEQVAVCEVNGEVTREVSVIPSRLLFSPPVDGSSRAATTLVVRRKDGKRLRVLSSRVIGSPEVSIELSPNHNGDGGELNLTAHLTSADPAFHRGVVEILTAADGESVRSGQLMIPFVHVGDTSEHKASDVPAAE